MRLRAKNLRKCLVKFFSAYPKKSLDPNSLQFRMATVAIQPRNTLLYIMINKIKTALVRAIVNSDTFKNTLENVVIKEIEFGIKDNDEVITQRELHRALDNFAYQNDIPDKDEVREIVSDELDECDFIDAVGAEDIALDLLKAEDIQVCSAEKLRVACLRTLANLIEGAE